MLLPAEKSTLRGGAGGGGRAAGTGFVLIGFIDREAALFDVLGGSRRPLLPGQHPSGSVSGGGVGGAGGGGGGGGYITCAQRTPGCPRVGAPSLVSGFVSGSCGALRPDCRCTGPAAPSGPQTGDKRGQRAAVRRRSCCQRPDIHQSINVVIDQPPDGRAGPAHCAEREEEEEDGPLEEGASLPEFSPIL